MALLESKVQSRRVFISALNNSHLASPVEVKWDLLDIKDKHLRKSV